MNVASLPARERVPCLEQTNDPLTRVVLLEFGPRFLDFYEQCCDGGKAGLRHPIWQPHVALLGSFSVASMTENQF